MAPHQFLENGVVDLKDTPANTQKIIDRNATNSPLLRLPAELRNRIACFVCHSDTGNVYLVRFGKHFVTSAHPVSVSSRRPVAINSLQHVCKQRPAKKYRFELLECKVRVVSPIFNTMYRSDTRVKNFRGTIRSTRKFKKGRIPGHKKAPTSWQQAKQRMENIDVGNLSFFADWSTFNEKDFWCLLRTTEDKFVKKYSLPTYAGEEDEVVKAVKGWVEKGIPATTVLREGE